MPRLEVRGIHKAFGPTRALVSVDLRAEAGEVHAVLGENGAGKSTLMGILGGAIAPDGGTILLDGAPYAPRDPAEARRAGIAVVHQELSLCPHLTVEENVSLGDEPTRRFGLVDRRRVRARAEAALAKVGARIDPRTKVAELGPAARQLVEIARALSYENAKVLVLDEPTSSLGADDAGRLLAIVAELRARGLAVLHVSHFLEEVFRIGDRHTVLRDGRSVAEGALASTTVDELVAAMAGAAVARVERARRQPGAPVLEVRELGGASRPRTASLVLRRGEILGVAGLAFAGRSELLRAIFGLEPVVRGEVRVGAFAGPWSPHASLARGVGLLSEDRKGEGLALGRSVEENLTLSKLPGVVRSAEQRAAARAWVERLSIRCADVGAPVSSLSGGNQQKVAIARLLHHDVDVLLLDEPTRGIDVRSKAQIHALLDRLVCEGPEQRRKAILMVSSSIPELLATCDRIAVMRRGVLGEARPVDQWTEHAILREAAVA